MHCNFFLSEMLRKGKVVKEWKGFELEILACCVPKGHG